MHLLLERQGIGVTHIIRRGIETFSLVPLSGSESSVRLPLTSSHVP